MKPLNCDYFPQLPARWHCATCQVNLSTPCIRARNNQWDPVPEQRCPICLGKLDSLGITHSIPPFWTRLPQFLTYPAKLEAFVHLLIATLINWLPSFTTNVDQLKMPFFKILMMGICLPLSTAVLLMYAFNCLNHSAKGNLNAPSAVLGNYASVKISLVVKQLLIYLLFVTLIFLSQRLGNLTYVAITGAILIALPASTMLLAMTSSMLTAMNPYDLWKIIKSIGWQYSIFYISLLVMVICQIFLQSQSFVFIHPFFLLPIITLIQGYFAFAMFAMMGYVLYQYHEKLGLKLVNEVVQDARKSVPNLSSDPFMNEITILLQENFRDEAIKRLKSKIYDTSLLVYHERLNQVLQAPGYETILLEQGRGYLETIFRSKETEAKQLHMAANAYQACLRVDADFFYPDPEWIFKLAEYTHQHGKHSLTRDLLSGFQERFPESRLIPKACFLLATTLVNYLGDDRQAKQVLLFLLNVYSEHDLIPQVREYLELVNKLEQ